MITQSFFKEFTVSDNFQLLTPGKTLHFYAGVDANNKPTIFILNIERRINQVIGKS